VRAAHAKLVVLLVLAGVSLTSAGSATVAGAQPGAAAPAEGEEDAHGVTFASGELTESAIVTALSTARAERMRSVGSTSITFQVDLAGPIDAAFKPESRFHPRGWLVEVAAYRVGRALGLDNVPPAVLRSMDRGQLRRRLEGTSVSLDDLANDLPASGSEVRGAFVYWVPGMLRSDLDTADGIARWSGWLATRGAAEATEIPAEHRALARDISNALVFDYLIGNRDRWSGGNARPLPTGRLVIRDHNLAFPATLAAGVHARMSETLRRTSRFSRSVVERIEALDEASLRETVADRSPESLLDARQLAGVLERRAALLTYVGALVEAHGEAAVLSFE
jgi:hypothetical protein